MPFEFKETDIEGVIEVSPQIFPDSRGKFLEFFRWDLFSQDGIHSVYSQVNVSVSKKNVIRGLHYQDGLKPQAKLVGVIAGKATDVVVDLRADSNTYLQYRKFDLDAKAHKLILIPVGCAHGFASLQDNTVLMYMCSNEYDILCDSGIRYNDPDLNIDWGIESPVVSSKDNRLQSLKRFLECGGLQVRTVC